MRDVYECAKSSSVSESRLLGATARCWHRHSLISQQKIAAPAPQLICGQAGKCRNANVGTAMSLSTNGQASEEPTNDDGDNEPRSHQSKTSSNREANSADTTLLCEMGFKTPQPSKLWKYQKVTYHVQLIGY